MGSSIKLGLMTRSAVALAAFAATAAHAQDAQPGDESEQPGPQTETASDDEPGEILVTAQRREERLKDVPLSVTVIDAQQLEQSGISGSRELAALTPGVTINTTGAAAQATVRGVGNTVVGGNAESPVALYIDGVYVSGQYFAVFDLANIESIQVLKGPQGTLFGRNATGGAILVTTSRPSSILTGSVSASYANFDDVRVGGFISGPITDTLRFDIAGNYHADNGYARDVVRGTRLSEYEEKSARAKLMFAPDGDTRITLIGDWGRVRDETAVSLKVVGRPATAGAFVPEDPREFALSFDPYSISEGRGVSLEIMHDFGTFTVKSLSAYRKTKNYSLTDQDRVAANIQRIDTTIRDEYITQEVTASNSNPGRFEWIAGAFYYGDTVKNPTFLNVGTLLNDAYLQVDAWALFGEGTFALTDAFKITAGLRYSNEERTFRSRRNAGNPTAAFRSLEADAWTPRVSLLYALTPASNIYATYSKGFKSGLFPAATFNAAPVNPETIEAYEVGYKLSRGGTSLNLATFYYDYKDLQVTTRTPAGLQTLLNAASAEIYGVDADLNVRLTQGLRLRLAGAYTHSEYKDFVNAPLFVPLAAGGNATLAGDASGNPLVRTPKWTATAGLRYETDLGSGKVDFSGDIYYNSGFSWTFDNRYRQDDYTLVNAQVGWSPPGENFRVAVFGRNLTNTLYSMGTSVTTAATAAAYARPRSYGVAVNFKF
jgi:iron complex outermembrane receptor protein